MTPEQVAIYRDRIAAARQPEGARHLRYEHGRGWNDCLDFVERQLKEVLGESNDKPITT